MANSRSKLRTLLALEFTGLCLVARRDSHGFFMAGAVAALAAIAISAMLSRQLSTT